MDVRVTQPECGRDFSDAGQSYAHTLSEKRLEKIKKKSQETGIPEDQLITIANESICEVNDKERRLLSFYADPKGDGSEPPWLLERIYWDYLKEFKTPEKTRKDTVTLSIRHELNQLLRAKVFFTTNTLPDEVKKVYKQGTSKLLPPEARPIGNLFCTIAFHDRDEEDPLASRRTLAEYGKDNVSRLDGISSAQRNLMYLRIDRFGQLSDAITFGRKAFLPRSSKKITIPTHQDDPALYQRAINQYWETIFTKAGDKLDGTITRLSRVPAQGITIDSNFHYLQEAVRMYMVAQPLEIAQANYPELSAALDIMNNKIRVAVVSMKSMTEYHPNISPGLIQARGHLKPETAEIHNQNHLIKSMQLAPWTPHDVCDQVEMLQGMRAEVERFPTLAPIFDKIVDQASPHMKTLGSAYKAPSHDTLDFSQ